MSDHNNQIELRELAQASTNPRPPAADGRNPTTNDLTNNIEEESTGHSLPPIDGGKAAWRLLCAAFVFESLLWGFPLSFGVFQNYYSQQPEFKDSPYISVIGTVASGMSYMAAPVMIYVTKRYSKYRKMMIWVGCTLMCHLRCITG